MSDWLDEYRQMIEDCEARESRMSEWECQFIESVQDYMIKKETITPKQAEKLEEVWERVTARG